METGGEAVPDPVSDAVNSLKNIEQEKLGRCPHTENSESGRPAKTEAVKPLCCAEQMVGNPTCQDFSPKRNAVLDASLQMSQGRGEEPVGLEVHGLQAADNAVPRRSLWGEEMSGVSRFHSSQISQNKVFKAALQSRQHSSDSGLDLSPDRVGPTDFSSSTRDQLKSEALGVLSCRGEGSSGLVVPEDTTSNLEEEVRNRSFGSTSIPAGSAEGDDPALLAMFRAVANSRLAVRSQQKDEPDFTPAQKLAILRDLYKAKPLVFLERFRAALKEEHLSCFQHLMGNYEADFYCAEVRRAGLGKTRHTRVRNKRYAALQQLIRGGEYFSDEQMRSREPLLYEQYIGQYLSNEELQALDSSKQEASHCLSGVLLDSYQEEVIQRRLQVQQEQEEACEEEEEEDSDDHDEGQSSNSEMDEWAPDPEEKAFLREEFTSRMYQRFLEGQDRDFNYSEVDENPDFDNLDIVSRDEEERYFDGEDPEEAEAMEAE